MLTVRALIERLQELDPDLIVVQSSDEKGNDFHLTAELGVGKFDLQEEEFYSAPEDTLDDWPDENDEEIDEYTVPALCIWPV